MEKKEKEEIMKKTNEDGSKKKQIITFIVGMLAGGIITASIFLIFKPNNRRNIPDFSQFNKNGKYLTAPIEGIVTDISSTATNGRFTVTVEFDNDGDIRLGMTINITI